MIYTLVKRNSTGNIDAIFSFDAVTAFDEEWTATVTTQTVEYGFNITDNINIEAPTYSIQAIISGYSLFSPEKEIVWDGENFYTKTLSDLDNSHVKARDSLIDIFQNRSILTLLESEANSNNSDLVSKEKELKSKHNKEINNCVITSLSIGNPSNATGAFLVSMKIQKINVAKVSVLELTKEEMSPLLRGLVVKPTVASAQSKSVSGEDIDGDNVALQDTDSFSEPTTEGARDGMGWHEVYDQKTQELKVIKDRTQAEIEMGDYMARTKQFCQLFQRSDGFYKRCRET